MSASQSGDFNLQEFDNLGDPLSGGRLYTYTYGTTTHKNAYTDQAGTIPHTYTSDGIGGQYIALNARGELPAPLYLATGSYDIALKTSAGATVWTRRADPTGDVPVNLNNVTGVLPKENGGTGGGTAIAARAALGVAPRATRIDVASVAGVVNLTTAAPDTDDIRMTGDLAVTGVTGVTDRVVRCVALGNMSMINSASLVTNRGADINCRPGDSWMWRFTSANVVEVIGFVSASNVPSVQGLFKNLAMSANGTNANIAVTVDEIVLESASNVYQTVRNVSLTVAGSSVGANGLDAGSLATSTWYSVWVIWNGTTTAGLLSTSATSPTLPSGYTHKARVGWIRTDSSGNKYPLAFKQFGRRARHVIAAATNVTALPTMASGTVGSAASLATAISTANFVPTTAASIEVALNGTYSSNGAAVGPNSTYTGGAGANCAPLSLSNGSAGASTLSTTGTIALESTNIYWYATGGSYVLCMGWEDNL